MDSEQAPTGGTPSGNDLGFSVDELTPRIVRQLGTRIRKGLVITEVRRYSEAARKGMTKYDIIREINQNEVSKVKDLENVLKRSNPGDSLLFLVHRIYQSGQEQDLFITLRIPQ